MARGLDRFNDEQRTFLQNYLKGGIFNRKSDKAKADTFKAFLDAETAAQRALDEMAGRSDQLVAIDAVLTAARARKDEGKFDDALAQAERALEMAGREQTELHHRDNEKRRLGGIETAVTVPDGATDDERDDLTNRKTAVRASLAGDPPSAAELTTAEEGLRDLATALETVKQAVAERARNRADLTARHAELNTRLGSIKALLARAATDSEHGTLSTSASLVQADIDALQTAVAGTDHSAVLTGLGEVAGITTALGDLDRDVDAALSRVLKASMTGTGTSDAQKDQLAALGKSDPDAMNAAIAALKGFEGALGDVQVDQADLLRRGADVSAAKADVGEKAEAVEAAKTARDEAYDLAIAAKEAKDITHAAHQTAYDAAIAFHTANTASLQDPGHPNYATAQAEYSRLYAAYEAAKEADDTAQVALNERSAEYQTKGEDLEAAKTALNTSKTALTDKTAQEKAAQGKKKMLDAIAFGPLNPDSAVAIGDPVAKQLVALYAKEPRLADKAVAVASHSGNPESVAIAAVTVCDRAASGFVSDSGTYYSNPEYPLTYAEQLIDMASNLPPAEAAKLDDYLADGRHFATVPGVVPVKNRQKSGKIRADFVGGEMLKDDGTLDFAKGRDALLDVMFHPKSLGFQTSMQTVHMLETIDFLEGSEEARTLLSTTPDPTDDGARGLLAGMTGKDANAVDKSDAQSAVLTAMMTPMYQGNVGSCFTTGSVIRMQQERPLEMMEHLRRMAVEGEFQPKTGDAVPVVQSVSADENGLLRSLEYTTATATARLADSGERNRLESALGKAVDFLSDDFKSKRREAVKAALKTAMSEAFDFLYDPTVESTGSDGNSTQGSFMLCRKPGGAIIDSHKAFSDALEEVIFDTLDKKDTKFRVSRQDVTDWTRTDVFLDQIRIDGKLPWELESGGVDSQAVQVLEGGDKRQTDMSPAADVGTMDKAERTKEVVADLLGRLGTAPGKNVPVGMYGKFNHSFNFVADHPSLEQFKGGTADDIKDNVQQLMIQKAADAAGAEMPLEKVNYLFDREMDALAKEAEGPAKAALETAMANNRPTVPMTPAAFDAHLKTATNDWAEAVAEAEADQWREDKISDGETVEDTDYDDYKTKRKASAGKTRDQGLSNRLRDDLGLPEIVLADTNWGDPAERCYFTLAPDPLTGEPRMYLKNDPPGTLGELVDADDWLACRWAETK